MIIWELCFCPECGKSFQCFSDQWKCQMWMRACVLYKTTIFFLKKTQQHSVTYLKSLRNSWDVRTFEQLQQWSEFHSLTKNVKGYLRVIFMLKLTIFLFYQCSEVVLNNLCNVKHTTSFWQTFVHSTPDIHKYCSIFLNTFILIC